MFAKLYLASLTLCAVLTTGCTPMLAQPIQVYPSSGLGLFDAELDGDLLTVTLGVEFFFVEGDPNSVSGFARDDYQWTDPKKVDDFKAAFKTRVAKAWSEQYTLVSGQEKVRVRVQVQEVSSDPHWRIYVRHYPVDAADSDALVCAPPSRLLSATECGRSAPGEKWGSVLLASTHVVPEYVKDKEFAEVKISFDEGLDVRKPFIGDGHLIGLPLVTLLQDPGWGVRVTGFATADEVLAGFPGERHPGILLARKRTDFVLGEIDDRVCGSNPGCLSSRLRQVSLHEVDPPFSGVWLDIYRDPLDTLVHEAGHMLGLDDEDAAAGPFDYPNYTALIHRLFDGLTCVQGDADSVMGRGSTVRPHHYVTFLEALQILTCDDDWEVEGFDLAQEGPNCTLGTPPTIAIASPRSSCVGKAPPD